MSGRLRKLRPEEITQEIRALRKENENTRCFDCKERGPTYVNMTLGTFVCNQCSGIQRSLNHRVKSIMMSTFTEEELNALQGGGNDRAKKQWLDRLPSNFKRPEHDEVDKLKTWMEEVYMQKKYMKKGKARKEESSDEEESMEQDRRSRRNSQSKKAVKKSVPVEDSDEQSSEGEEEEQTRSSQKSKPKKALRKKRSSGASSKGGASSKPQSAASSRRGSATQTKQQQPADIVDLLDFSFIPAQPKQQESLLPDREEEKALDIVQTQQQQHQQALVGNFKKHYDDGGVFDQLIQQRDMDVASMMMMQGSGPQYMQYSVPQQQQEYVQRRGSGSQQLVGVAVPSQIPASMAMNPAVVPAGPQVIAYQSPFYGFVPLQQLQQLPQHQQPAYQHLSQQPVQLQQPSLSQPIPQQHPNGYLLQNRLSSDQQTLPQMSAQQQQQQQQLQNPSSRPVQPGHMLSVPVIEINPFAASDNEDFVGNPFENQSIGEQKEDLFELYAKQKGVAPIQPLQQIQQSVREQSHCAGPQQLDLRPQGLSVSVPKQMEKAEAPIVKPVSNLVELDSMIESTVPDRVLSPLPLEASSKPTPPVEGVSKVSQGLADLVIDEPSRPSAVCPPSDKPRRSSIQASEPLFPLVDVAPIAKPYQQPIQELSRQQQQQQAAKQVKQNLGQQRLPPAHPKPSYLGDNDFGEFEQSGEVVFDVEHNPFAASGQPSDPFYDSSNPFM